MKFVTKLFVLIIITFMPVCLASTSVIADGEPVNDAISAAIDLGATPGATISSTGSRTGNTNIGATLQTDEFSGNESWSKSVWFKAKLSAGNWEIGLSAATPWDSLLTVGTLTDSVASTPFQSGNYIETRFDDDSGSTSVGGLSRVSFTSDGTSTYYIGVAGYEGGTGIFTLEFNKLETMTNNNITDAIAITPPSLTSSTTLSGQHNFDATVESNESQLLLADGWASSVWYKMTPTVTATYKLTVSPTFEATSIFLRKSFKDIPFVEGDILNKTRSSFVGHALLNSGTTYYLGVGHVLGAESLVQEGSFSLTVARTAVPTQVTDTEVALGASTSISWTAPSPPTGITWDLEYDVDLEHSTEPLNRSISTTNTTVSLQRLRPGTWFYTIYSYDSIQQIGGGLFSGSFVVTATSNDFFASATSLIGDSGSTNDTFAYATREPGEPLHSSSQLNSSLWYRYAPASTGSYTMAVSALGIIPYLSVYSGGSLGTLTRLSTNLDSATWSGKSGDIYYIAITSSTDYKNSANGSFILTRSIVVAPVTPPPAAVASPTPPAPVVTTPPAPVVTTPPAPLVTTPPAPEVTTPPQPAPVAFVVPPSKSLVKTATRGANATALTISKNAKISVPKGATVSVSVKSDSKKICSVSKGKIKFTKKSRCNVAIKVNPKKGNAKVYTVAVTP
jgi:hypothetical protein